MPVVLVAFTAARESNTTLLTWTTTSEINSDHFEIEWSPDAKTWQRIGEVACKNTGAAATHYTFTDLENRDGTVYYRLKILDDDNSFAYSRICSVQSMEAGFVAFPNPIEADSPFSLLTGRKEPDKITFFDLSGKTVLESTGVPGRDQLRRLLPGRYLVKVLFTDSTTASRVMIRRN